MKIHKSAQLERSCSKDKTRFALQNPYIDRSEPGKFVAVATTGAIMAVVPVSDLKDGEHGFVPVNVLKAARNIANGANDHCDIEFTGENSRMFKLFNGATMPDEVPANQTFCQWRNVLPDFARKNVIKLSLNPAALLALAEAMGAGKGVTLEIMDEVAPLIVRPSNYKDGHRMKSPLIPDAFGIIMPIVISS